MSKRKAPHCDSFGCGKPADLVHEEVLCIEGEVSVFRYWLCSRHRAWMTRRSKVKAAVLQPTPDELLLARWCKKEKRSASCL